MSQVRSLVSVVLAEAFAPSVALARSDGRQPTDRIVPRNASFLLLLLFPNAVQSRSSLVEQQQARECDQLGRQLSHQGVLLARKSVRSTRRAMRDSCAWSSSEKEEREKRGRELAHVLTKNCGFWSRFVFVPVFSVACACRAT